MADNFARCFGQDLMRGEHVLGGGKVRTDDFAALDELGDGLTWKGRVAGFDGYRVKEGLREETQVSGTSIFDPVLCELVYKWFCPAGGQVLDPFAGGSVRGLVASLMGRRYLGVELSAAQVAANQAQRDLGAAPYPEWVCGDSRAVKAFCGDSWAGADLLFSCPPYADLEVYSDDPRDLSAMAWPAFKAVYTEIIAACVGLMRPNSFAVFVVGDARGKDGYYYGLPWATVAAFEAAGARLYNEAVLVTAVGSLPVRINAQFTSGRKLGKTHQNVLMFCNGDWRKAAAKCERLETASTGVIA